MGFFRVENLSKSFGGMKAVDDLSFEVNEGEILSLIGPNGAGKTTVFNLITSFLKPTGGNIIFEDENITNTLSHKIAKRGIVRIFQLDNLFLDMTVLDNLDIAHHLDCKASLPGYFFNSKRARKDHVKFKESSIKLLKYFDLLPYQSELARSLAHGHKRALAIAIAMAAQPRRFMAPGRGISQIPVEPFVNSPPFKRVRRVASPKRIVIMAK